jgi:hypothetical protein
VDGVRYVSGELDAVVTSTYTDSVDSCQFVPTDPPIVPCSFTAPAQTIPTDASLAVDFQPWSDSTSSFKVTWSLPAAEIGVASGSYVTDCIFDYILFQVPVDEQVSSEPVSKFTATGPQTVSFSGTKHMERPSLTTGVDTMDYTWSMSITYQRVDENGNPL